jgi:hypothetical protein
MYQIHDLVLYNGAVREVQGVTGGLGLNLGESKELSDVFIKDVEPITLTDEILVKVLGFSAPDNWLLHSYFLGGQCSATTVTYNMEEQTVSIHHKFGSEWCQAKKKNCKFLHDIQQAYRYATDDDMYIDVKALNKALGIEDKIEVHKKARRDKKIRASRSKDIAMLSISFYDEFEPFHIGGREFEGIEEIIKEYPSLRGANSEFDECLTLVIDIKNGNVINWPKGVDWYIGNLKLKDTGVYALLASDSSVVCSYKGYTPKYFDKYGDYITLEIDKTGHINGWAFSKKDIDEIIEKSVE